MRISKGLKQAYDLQDFTYEAALALRDRLRAKGERGKLYVGREDAQAVGSLVKAWESCQERIRIHRNKPMPGVLRPDKPKPKNSRKVPGSAAQVQPSPVPESEAEPTVESTACASPTSL